MAAARVADGRHAGGDRALDAEGRSSITMQSAGLAPILAAANWLIPGLDGSDRGLPLVESPQRLGRAAVGVVIQVDKLSAARLRKSNVYA
ncbi:hypothetical protein [Mesorhizobium sp. dw_380]|uniref:hypothetical protein n=1 Tax=Mesorhizobium sp. dw_380 TaxID=2812001 RepID=UPI001BDF17C4|nr:hypothetical protein [Mesorhizobium sp. dw_380]